MTDECRTGTQGIEEVRELRQALERERVMGRIRDRILALDDLDSFSAPLESEWVASLKELGIPVYRVSLQQPLSGGEYGVHWTLLPREETPREQDEHWLSYPWVREAWEGGRPVVIDRRRLEECRFWDREVRSIIEVPLPGGGSLGVSSRQDQAFDEPAVATLETFAGILATALRRLRHLEAVQRSERTLNQAQQVAHVGSWAWHVQTNRIEGSDELFRIVGLERSAFSGDLGDAIERVVHPEDRAVVEQAALAVSGGEPPTALECRLVRPDGAVRVVWVETGERTLDDAGRPVILTGIVQDITERRSADRALQTARQWQEAEQAVPAAIARMEGPEGLEEVLAECARQLRLLSMRPFDALTLQVINEDASDFTSTLLDHPLDRRGLCWPPRTDNATAFPWVIEVWRSQAPRYDPCTPEGGSMEPGMSVIDVPFSHGTLAVSRKRPHAFTDGDVRTLSRMAVLVSSGFHRFLSQLERVRTEESERLGLALQRVRGEALLMEREEDWQRVVRAVHEELAHFLVFDECAINLVDRGAGEGFHLVAMEAGIYRPLVDWRDRPAVRQAIETGLPVYRRNRADPLFSPRMAPKVNSVLDVPFSHGTVAVNSSVEDAFSERDIQVLEQFAQVLSEACRRMQDISARVRVSQALRESEEEYRRLFSGMSVGCAVHEIISDEDGRPIDYVTLSANPAYEVLLGIRAGDLVGRRASEILPPGELAEWLRIFGLVAPDGGTISYETWSSLVRKYFAGSAFSVQRQGRLAITYSDITERKQAEIALRVDLALQRVRNQILLMESEADWQKVVADVVSELSSLVAVRDCSIGLIEPQGKGVRFYRAAKGRTFPPKEVSEVHPAILWAMETGEPVYRRSRRDPLFEPSLPQAVNSVIDLPFNGGVLAANSEKEEAFSEADIAVLRRFAQIMSEARRRLQDITERQRLEQELVRMQRLRAAAELSAGVSHNLNNILTGVLLPAQMLLTMTDDPEIRAVVGDIVVSGERAAELVHRLHLSVRGKDDLAPRPVSLSLAVDQVIQVTRPLWKDVPEARGVAVEVVTDLAATPPIRGTESGLHDLLTNLLLNAVDALPRGGTITVSARAEDGGARLEFSDNGIGMDEQTRLRVFEPFFTTKPTVGTGLGLSTLHNTVTQWGGKVEVESAQGSGTTFRLWLPVWRGEVGDEIEQELTALPERARVLVIDDDQVVGSVVAASLRPRHQVDTFTDPEEALAKFLPGRYDLAVIDLGMPGTSGEQVARRIAEVDPAVVRVLFSGWELDGNDPRRGPFDLFLRKPVEDLVTLETLIAQAMRLHDDRVDRGLA